MQRATILTDLAIEEAILSAEAVGALLMAYRQSDSHDPFPEWARGQDSVDGKVIHRLERIFEALEFRCLECDAQNYGVDLDSDGDEATCPNCGSPMLKRIRGGTTILVRSTEGGAEPDPSSENRQPLPRVRRGRSESSSSVSGVGSNDSTQVFRDGRRPDPLRPSSTMPHPGLASPAASGDVYPPDASAASQSGTRHGSSSSSGGNTSRRELPSVEEIDEATAVPAGLPTLSEVRMQVPGLDQLESPMPRFDTIGNWALLEEVGAGGAGVVYQAKHQRLNRFAAIKVLRRKADTLLDRFRREAQIIADLDHPRIVRLYDFGDHQGYPYLVMEWVEGETLRDRVDSDGPLTLVDALQLAIHCCEALELAHSLGVIHRDIKPDNLMITDDGRLKVTDFGLARIEDSKLTVEGMILGTPSYMAPEQIYEEQILPATDVYSLGATLYFLATGHSPFAHLEQQGNAYRQLVQQANEPFPSLLDWLPGAPELLDSAIQQMTSKNPAERPQTVGEVASILRAIRGSMIDEVDSAEHRRTRSIQAVNSPDILSSLATPPPGKNAPPQPPATPKPSAGQKEWTREPSEDKSGGRGVMIKVPERPRDTFWTSFDERVTSLVHRTDGPLFVVADLRQCKAIGSTGISIMVRTSDTVARTHGKVVTVGMTRPLKITFEMLGTAALFDNFETTDQALDALEIDGFQRIKIDH